MSKTPPHALPAKLRPGDLRHKAHNSILMVGYQCCIVLFHRLTVHGAGVIQSCDLQGKPVDPITLSLTSLAPTGSTLPSNTAGNPFTSTPADSNPSTSLGSQASSISSPPASSSVAPEKTGSAMGVKCGSSGVVAAVLVVISFVARLV
ncbi:hypothetical protein B0H19DRAFT_1253273 [Mycena capillaripes]|nr:hypothetical protein B0H19DRAFT_1253273 [Mycena capillaripes]